MIAYLFSHRKKPWQIMVGRRFFLIFTLLYNGFINVTSSAALSNRMRREWGAEGSAVIAFGGSYGGMLASWMRILYPSAIDGGYTHACPLCISTIV